MNNMNGCTTLQSFMGGIDSHMKSRCGLFAAGLDSQFDKTQSINKNIVLEAGDM